MRECIMLLSLATLEFRPGDLVLSLKGSQGQATRTPPSHSRAFTRRRENLATASRARLLPLASSLHPLFLPLHSHAGTVGGS